MKIAAVYTSTTPELVQMVDDQLKNQFEGMDLEIISYKDPSILQEARDNGYMTQGCVRRMLDLYEQGARDGADIIFNICSSVGDVAKLAKALYEMMGIGFVRIDEEMAKAAVKAGKRIGVLATLQTTLQPTKRLVQECADAMGKEIVIVDALAEGAFGINQEQFKQMLIDTGSKVKDDIDVLVFAQGSMAYAEKDVSDALGVPVFSSIKFGTEAVRAAAGLKNK